MSLREVAERGGAKRLVLESPATLEKIGEVPQSDGAAVLAAVDRARAAQASWGALSVRERMRVLGRAKDELLGRADEVVELIHAETGKPRREALTVDVIPAADALDLYSKSADAMLADEKVRFRPMWAVLDSRLVYQPLGVIGVISPWNFPLGIPTSEVGAALAAGNAVVLKPSEHTPLTALKMRDLFERAGVPKGAVEVVTGDGEAGKALAAAPLDKLVFTGSERTGRKVLQAAAERLMPVVLELGGSDPMLVLADADLSSAVDGALWGRFANCGQTCAAVKRLFLQDSIAGPFLDRLAEKARALRVGADRAFDADVGPLISHPQRGLLEGQVEEARSGGARVVTGGARPEGLAGYFYLPTILAGLKPSMRVLREETFGPVLAVQTFRTPEEGLALANDSTFALSGSIWSKDLDRARALARRLDGGTIWLNNAVYTYGVAETPWGGEKLSGLGRTHGPDALRAFSRQKHISSEGVLPSHKPWWFPYSGGREAFEDYRGLIEGLYGRGVAKAVRGVARVWREARARRKAGA